MASVRICGLVLAAALAWTAGPASAEPKGRLVVGLADEPSTFDPHVITGFPMTMAYPLVFDTLLFRDREGKVVPHLATSYRLAEPTVWEFKLREGVKFTNGEPLDAEAVKFSIERILDPKLKSFQYSFFRSIARVEAVDRSTVRFHTKYPDMLLASVLSLYGAIVPPQYYRSRDPKYLARNPVGSGPYRLVGWKKGAELVYEANPQFWRAGAARIKTGVVKIIAEPTTRVAALVAGDVDIVNVVPPQLTRMVGANPDLEVVSGGSPRVCYVIMVIKPGAPWADARVRRALNYAVNKDEIVRHIAQGYARKVATNVGPDSYGFNPDLKPYPYDPARARELLAEAGYPKGFSVELWTPLGRYLMGKEVAEAIAGQMDKVGVKVQTITIEYGRLVEREKARWEPHSKPFWRFACRMDLMLHSDGMYSGAIHSRSTWGGVREKWLDKLMDEARSETDDAKRLQKYP